MKLFYKLSALSSFFMLSIFLFQHAEHDWDLPGYMGAVLNIEHNDPKYIHQTTYTELQQQTTAQEFNAIIGHGEGYRYAQCQNEQYFYSQLQYYDAKIAYVIACFILFKLGFSLINAILLVNVLAYSLASLCIWEILKFSLKHQLLAFLGTWAMLLWPWMTDLVKIASPDALSLMILLGFYYAYVKKMPWALLSFLLMLSVLIRPDNLIFAILAFALLWFENKQHQWFILGASTLMLLAFYLNMKTSHYAGWGALFYDTFISRRNLASPLSIGFNEYIVALGQNVIHLKKVLSFTGLGLMISYFLHKKKNLPPSTLYFPLLVFTSIIAKILLFPLNQTRMYMPLLLLGFLHTLQLALQEKNTDKPSIGSSSNP
jgi:hypothetical protein